MTINGFADKLGKDFLKDVYQGNFSVGTLVQNRETKEIGIITRDFSFDHSIEVTWLQSKDKSHFSCYISADYSFEIVSSKK